MLIRDFLMSYNGSAPVKIYDEYACVKKTYYHTLDALNDYGYFQMKQWSIEDGCVVIKTRTQY